MKLLRRAIIVVGVLLVALVLLLALGYRMMRGSPSWYHPGGSSDPQHLADAADRVQHKFEAAHSWTAIAQNQQQHPNVIPQSVLGPTTRPGILDPLELTLTDDELNAFFQRWDAEYHWTNQTAEYVKDPQVAIRDGSFIVAAMVPQMKVVVSLWIQPTLDNGLLRLKLAKVLAGALPLPQTVWQSYRQQLVDELDERLPSLQREAALKRDGSANDQMVQAVLVKLLLHVVRDEPADPILFLPYMQNYKEHSLPVKLTQARIDDAAHSLTLRFEPLNSDERDRLVASVDKP